MNADEFLNQITPAARRSKLSPLRADIQKLRTAGCSLKQVQAFLLANEVVISLSGLAKFVTAQQALSEEIEPTLARPYSDDRSISLSEPGPKPTNTIGNTAIKSIAEITADHPGLSKKAILDTYARQFTSDRKNSVAQKFEQR